jgi:hypothetical protein
MRGSKLTGSFVALITPFNKDGSVDFAAFRTLLAFQQEHGTAAVLIMGSTGETSMLSPEEKKRIIIECAKMKTARMPIFFGATGNNTESTIANVRFAKVNGADGAILAAPAYICAPEADIERFFLDVADATELPLGIYNNPPRVKSDLTWEHLLRMFRHPNYVVHKESTARVGQVAQVLAAKPDVSVMCCDSPNLGLIVPTMSLGEHDRQHRPCRARDHLDPMDELPRGRGFQEHISAHAPAPAFHLFRDQPGCGQIADEGAWVAGRRSAQAADRSRRRGAGQGRSHRPGDGARQALRLQSLADLGRCSLSDGRAPIPPPSGEVGERREPGGGSWLRRRALR